MADLWVVLTIVGFFLLCVALVHGCDRIIGSDDETDLGVDAPAPEPGRVQDAREVAA